MCWSELQTTSANRERRVSVVVCTRARWAFRFSLYMFRCHIWCFSLIWKLPAKLLNCEKEFDLFIPLSAFYEYGILQNGPSCRLCPPPTLTQINKIERQKLWNYIFAFFIFSFFFSHSNSTNWFRNHANCTNLACLVRHRFRLCSL